LGQRGKHLWVAGFSCWILDISGFGLPEAMNTSERGYNLFVIFFSLLVVGAVAMGNPIIHEEFTKDLAIVAMNAG
jgi:hypothetical protein